MRSIVRSKLGAFLECLDSKPSWLYQYCPECTNIAHPKTLDISQAMINRELSSRGTNRSIVRSLYCPPDWVQIWNWSVFGMSFLYMGQETTISHGFCDLNQSELSIQILLLRNYNNKIHFNYNSNNQMEQILYITDKLSLYASNLKCFQSKHKYNVLHTLLAQISNTYLLASI